MRERRIKRGEEEKGGMDGWIHDRDENVPLLFSLTTQLSIYLIFLVMKDLQGNGLRTWHEVGKNFNIFSSHLNISH